MEVVNCKVKHIRPRYKNLKEWMADSNNVYIGRAGIVFIDGERFPKHASPFANPFKVGEVTRDQVLMEYEKYILNQLKISSGLRTELLKLKGKRLGCWCKPDPCHGDILIKIVASLDPK